MQGSESAREPKELLCNWNENAVSLSQYRSKTGAVLTMELHPAEQKMSSAHPTGYPPVPPYSEQAMRRDRLPQNVRVEFQAQQHNQASHGNVNHNGRQQYSNQMHNNQSNNLLGPGAFADVELGAFDDQKQRFILPREQRPRPWSSKLRAIPPLMPCILSALRPYKTTYSVPHACGMACLTGFLYNLTCSMYDIRPLLVRRKPERVQLTSWTFQMQGCLLRLQFSWISTAPCLVAMLIKAPSALTAFYVWLHWVYLLCQPHHFERYWSSNSDKTRGFRTLTPVEFTIFAGTWHWRRQFMFIAFLGLLASNIVYIYFRCRYTLKIATNRKDASGNAHYRISVYSILTLVVELLCMAAMALYAGMSSIFCHYLLFNTAYSCMHSALWPLSRQLFKTILTNMSLPCRQNNLQLPTVKISFHLSWKHIATFLMRSVNCCEVSLVTLTFYCLKSGGLYWVALKLLKNPWRNTHHGPVWTLASMLAP